VPGSQHNPDGSIKGYTPDLAIDLPTDSATTASAVTRRYYDIKTHTYSERYYGGGGLTVNSERGAHDSVLRRLRGLDNSIGGHDLEQRYNSLDLTIITFGGFMEGCPALHSLIGQLAARATVHKGMAEADYRAAVYTDWFRRRTLASLSHVIITGRMQVYHAHACLVTLAQPRRAGPGPEAHITDMTDDQAEVLGAHIAVNAALDGEL
jgi:hypothetical protein